MAKPWDRYKAAQASSGEQKPWERYRATAPSPGTAPTGAVSEFKAYLDSALGNVQEDSYGRMLETLESGGRADAQAPGSSATGLHQFTEGTWKATVKRAKPAWAEGLDDAQLLELRKDPEKSREMEQLLREENAAALFQAGLPATPVNLYAGHHFGAKKGVAFAKASPDTPMAAILTPAQLQANPYLRGKTKQEVISNWSGRAKMPWLKYQGAQ